MKKIHVLIIGIQKYDSDFLDDLPGVSETAWSLVDWWANANSAGRMLPGSRLSSIRVLTDEPSEAFVAPEGVAVEESEKPNASSVERALNEWASSLDADSIGVLHWMGHGGALGAHGGPLQALFLPDLSNDRNQSLDWANVERGLRSLSSEPTVWCFVDACRVEPEDQAAGIDVRPFATKRIELRKSNLNVLHSSMFGKEAFCATRIEPAVDDLSQGPVFSNALRLALDRFAATHRSNVTGVAAHAADIEEATQHRMIQWLVRRHCLDWEEYIFGEAEPIIERKPGKNHKTPLVTSPNPHSMLDVALKRKRTSRDACRVVAMTTQTSDRPEVSLVESPNGWNADLSRPFPGQSSYAIQVERTPRIMGRSRLSRREEEVFPSHPVHSLIVDD